jgi:predicted enzyme related to lactoylglutathione lyase
MQAMTGHEVADDVPPHWAVTFAVDGTDEAAARAAELGGMAVVAPFDAGPARVAVLRDPQGAMFSVSTYTPPE